MLAVLMVWSLVMPSHAQVNSCVNLKTSSKALKAGSNPKVFEMIYPGESIKILASANKKKHFKINLGGDSYWILSNNFTTVESSQCEINMCVFLNADTEVHGKPNKKHVTQMVDSGIYNVVTKVKSWYRVKIPSGFVWLTGSQLKQYKRSCDSTGEEEDASASFAANAPKGWLFGVEAGYIQNVDAEPLKNLLTPIPAAGVDVNDDAYNSPFIEEVNDGSGWFAGVTAEFPMFWRLRNKIALGYKTRSLDYVQRQNPHNASVSFVTYDDLTAETVSADFSFVYGTTTIKFEGWSFLGMLWQPGILLGIDYSLDDFAVEFRTAPLKLTQVMVPSGYQDIEFLYGPRLDVNIGFFTLGLTAIFTDYGMEPTAIMGVQF